MKTLEINTLSPLVMWPEGKPMRTSSLKLEVFISMPRSHLSRWSSEIIFLVPTAEKTWSHDTGIGQSEAVILEPF